MNKVAENLIRTGLIAAFFLAPGPSRAADAPQFGDEDVNFEYTTVTTKEGLTFRVPEDMPIENRGGIVAPIPFDEYTYSKFKKLEKRLEADEARITLLEKELASYKEREKKLAAAVNGGTNAP